MIAAPWVTERVGVEAARNACIAAITCAAPAAIRIDIRKSVRLRGRFAGFPDVISAAT
ncbi:hypothetical protein [Rhodoplanes elegans]|uniref:hypothetical protein n=1 Tax=Rhodoplanes elegans TaxID=29408 RepID=UPI0014730E7F|nr:hypothetical protein [Rhodoplanes elegans]